MNRKLVRFYCKPSVTVMMSVKGISTIWQQGLTQLLRANEALAGIVGF